MKVNAAACHLPTSRRFALGVNTTNWTIPTKISQEDFAPMVRPRVALRDPLEQGTPSSFELDVTPVLAGITRDLFLADLWQEEPINGPIGAEVIGADFAFSRSCRR
ncbi:hypothetical protein ABIF86_000343 [Bradyrhizobium japonicum]